MKSTRRVGLWIVLTLGAILVPLAACSGGTETDTSITVEEAMNQGYQAEVEPCSNRIAFPDLYEDIPYVDLGDGQCEFYYSPARMEATAKCTDEFLSGDFVEYIDCVREALKD